MIIVNFNTKITTINNMNMNREVVVENRIKLISSNQLNI